MKVWPKLIGKEKSWVIRLKTKKNICELKIITETLKNKLLIKK